LRNVRLNLKPRGWIVTAHKLENDPQVSAAIQKTLQKRGLDEQSKQHYVDLLWRYAESEAPADEKRQLTALRILGKAFVGENITVDKPETLRISGIEEGLRNMGVLDA